MHNNKYSIYNGLTQYLDLYVLKVLTYASTFTETVPAKIHHMVT